MTEYEMFDGIPKRTQLYRMMEVMGAVQKITKKYEIQINYLYKIKDIDELEKLVTMQDMQTNKMFTVDLKTFSRIFKMPYARTCHSWQGETIREPVTIMDIDFKHAIGRWLWTAITRTDDLDKLTILRPSKYSQDPCEIINSIHYSNYFCCKIGGYKTSDVKTGRIQHMRDEADFVTPSWIVEKYIETNGLCMRCGELIDIGLDPMDKIPLTDLTVDRIDDNLPHLMSNCGLSHTSCNVAYGHEAKPKLQSKS